jgi:hypothetical protein
MKQIISTGSECRLSGGITIPEGGSVNIADEKLQHLRLHDEHFGAQLRSGSIVVADAEQDQEITGEIVAKARRSELIEIITGTGEYTEDDLEGVYVEDTDDADGLRTLAARLVFGDQ